MTVRVENAEISFLEVPIATSLMYDRAKKPSDHKKKTSDSATENNDWITKAFRASAACNQTDALLAPFFQS